MGDFTKKQEAALRALHTYCTTDMAAELYRTAEAREQHRTDKKQPEGMIYQKTSNRGITVEKLTVSTDEASHMLGKSIGTYYTVHTLDLRLLSQMDYDACRICLREALIDAMRTLLPDYRMPNFEEQCKRETSKERPKELSMEETDRIDAIGEEAIARLSTSPEWDMSGHLYDAIDPAEDVGVTCVTDIPPEPVPENEPLEIHTVLAVGLGNPELTPDAFGPLCIRSLSVTRHLTGDDSPLPEPLRSSLHALSAFCPMVLGQTGIETLSLVRGAVDAVKPDLVILLDALAASDPASLFRTVQISTTGIHPGGGIGNKRQPIVEETIGVPVITIGVPTVIASSTMIYRTLEGAGLLPQEEDGANTDAVQAYLRETLAEQEGSFVAPKDADLSVKEFARLVSLVINEVVLGEETAAEWFRRV